MPEVKPTDTEMLMAFVDKMLTDKGFVLSADEKQKLRAVVFSGLEASIEQAIIRALPDEKLLELDAITEGTEMSDEQIQAVFEGAGVDFEPVVVRTMNDYKARFLAMDEAQTQEFVQQAVGAQVVALEMLQKSVKDAEANNNIENMISGGEA